MLRQIHDELDEAVLEAYGWQDLKEALHSCGAGGCAAIEKREALPNDDPSAPRQECRGSSDALLIRLIRWLRPDYQNPTSATPHPVQTTLAGTEAPSSKSKIQNQQSSIDNPSSIPWPDRLPEQVAIIRKLISSGDRSVATPHNAESLSALFGRKNKKRTEQIEGILETLKGLGQL